MSRYLCHLRRRDGRTQTELNTHDGEPPRVGTLLNVLLQAGDGNETVAVRIGSLSVEDNADGIAIIHVYMDEIK